MKSEIKTSTQSFFRFYFTCYFFNKIKNKLLPLILLITLFLTSFNINSLSAQLVLKNRYLKITMDEESGRFTIKTINGNPLEKDDSNFDILDNSCWPPTTFASIKYNSKVYKFGSSAGSIIQSDIINKSLIYSWKIKDVIISQIISFYMKSSNPCINLKYIINNHYQKQNNIGIRLCLDTSISKDFPVYVDSNHSRIIKETNYTNLSEWYSINSVTDPGIYFKCILSNDNKNKPQKVVFSSWDKFDKNKWGINLDNKKPFYNSYTFSKKEDGAVGIFWENSLMPNDEKTCSLIFSIDSPKIDGKSLAIDYLIPENIEDYSISFKIENKSLANIEDISIKFETDKPNKIKLLNPEVKIKNLPLFGSIIIPCLYSLNGDTKEVVSFKVKVSYPYKISFEKEFLLEKR